MIESDRPLMTWRETHGATRTRLSAGKTTTGTDGTAQRHADSESERTLRAICRPFAGNCTNRAFLVRGWWGGPPPRSTGVDLERDGDAQETSAPAATAAAKR